MIRNNQQLNDELRDPMLSALLREAYADDPALAPAPGRSDRIMRKIMTSGVRPAPHYRWTPFAWAGGALATAALLLLLLLGGGKPDRDAIVHLPKDKAPIAIPVVPPDMEPGIASNHPAPVPEKVPAVRSQAPRQPRLPRLPRQEQVAVRSNDTTVAAAYLAMAESATQMGDHEAAYEMYNAAYEVEPSSVTLMASANALERQANETSNM